jgi:hypothetical protein
VLLLQLHCGTERGRRKGGDRWRARRQCLDQNRPYDIQPQLHSPSVQGLWKCTKLPTVGQSYPSSRSNPVWVSVHNTAQQAAICMPEQTAPRFGPAAEALGNKTDRQQYITQLLLQEALFSSLGVSQAVSGDTELHQRPALPAGGLDRQQAAVHTC